MICGVDVELEDGVVPNENVGFALTVIIRAPLELLTSCTFCENAPLTILSFTPLSHEAGPAVNPPKEIGVVLALVPVVVKEPALTDWMERAWAGPAATKIEPKVRVAANVRRSESMAKALTKVR